MISIVATIALIVLACFIAAFLLGMWLERINDRIMRDTLGSGASVPIAIYVKHNGVWVKYTRESE